MTAAEPVIVGAEIVAGHDGAAELVVRLNHPNGGSHAVVLDATTGFQLMSNCGVSDLEALTGHSWRKLLGQ